MRYTIDRISGGIAVCEDENGDSVKISATELPKDAREGDLILRKDNGWSIDADGTRERQEAMAAKLRRLIE